jgi:hypothetical protein
MKNEIILIDPDHYCDECHRSRTVAKSPSGSDNVRPRQFPIVQNDFRRSGNKCLIWDGAVDKHQNI